MTAPSGTARHGREQDRIDGLVRRLGAWRRPVLVAWALAVLASGVVSTGLPDLLSGGGWFVPGSQSARVAEDLSSGFTGRGASTVTLVVRDERAKAGEARFDERVLAVVAQAEADSTLGVTTRLGYADLTGDNRTAFVGRDGRTAIELLGLELDDGTARRVLPSVQERLSAQAQPGLTVSLVSEAAFWGEATALSKKGLEHAELVTLPLLLVILLLLYGGVAAALSSLAVAASSIAFTTGVLTLLAEHVELSVFVQNAATMLGLGIGVDYSLFIISRFQAELRAGRSVDDALAVTLRTSGETVFASGMTVLLALGTLFIVPLNVIRSIALGGMVVVAFSMLVSLLLLPVLLRTLGSRVDWGRLPFVRGPSDQVGLRWHAAARRIMSRPVLFLVAGVAALLALALPALGLRTFTPDARIIPESSTVRIGYEQVREGFGVGLTAPVQVVLTAPDPLSEPTATAAVVALRDRLRALPGATAVHSALDVGERARPQSPLAVLESAVQRTLPPDARRTLRHYATADGRRLVLEVVPSDYAASPAAHLLLRDVRRVAATSDGPWRADVGGESAAGVDSNAVIRSHLPAVIAVMLGVVYLLLLLTFRSLLLPLKAILMNLLSLGATYGVLVLVFQRGFGVSLLGGAEQGDVQNFVPVLLLALLFALSTDYEVFLLSRVREEYVATGDDVESVAQGLAHTAPLISGAALLMVAVFGAFAFTTILPIKQLGFGMAVAIALDATIVRLVIVPSSMRLLGAWNWWLPGRRSPAPASHAAVELPLLSAPRAAA